MTLPICSLAPVSKTRSYLSSRRRFWLIEAKPKSKDASGSGGHFQVQGTGRNGEPYCAQENQAADRPSRRELDGNCGTERQAAAAEKYKAYKQEEREKAELTVLLESP